MAKKKMRTRLGVDGYDYPYTHEDLIFDNDGISVGQKLDNVLIAEREEDEFDIPEFDTGSGSNANIDLSDYAKKADLEKIVQDTKEYVDDKLNGLQIVQLTQEEYDALSTKDPNTIYIIA